MQTRHLVTLLILASLLIAGLFTVISPTTDGNSVEDACIDPQSDISIENGVSVPQAEANVTGLIQYDRQAQSLTITYQNISASTEFWVDLPTTHYSSGVRVADTTGFQNLSSSNSYSFKWNGETENPQITFSVVPQQSTLEEDHEYAAASQWGFFPVPAQFPSTNLTFEGPGFVGDQFIVAGPNTVYRQSAGCQDIRLIVPEAVNLSDSSDEILESIVSASNQFSAGPRYSYVNAYAVGDPIRIGGAAETHEFWVHESGGV